jgi:hypothetical protein
MQDTQTVFREALAPLTHVAPASFSVPQGPAGGGVDSRGENAPADTYSRCSSTFPLATPGRCYLDLQVMKFISQFVVAP